ncbi:homoserine dehydrogenase [Vagococcus salmoninarum]|uniref:Homoserine dehydrogenase n=1 Tax=Vagococcus salmoninarum TaxID=2739 RepID=A0A429ZU54_9ENTE|nr:homoserine dehydrogenase [Vagococcus salmoninarum]RST97211.1 homoserine dehydrogenase [Vagococcus salmoninarum]
MEKLKVAVLGLGTVGASVPLILREHQEKISQVTGVEILVSKALVRNIPAKKALAEEYDIELTTNYEDILNDSEIKIVVELIGQIEPAKTYILEALAKGKHVVTANKDLLALHGKELISAAKKAKVDLYYEASVAGGIPILRTIANSLAADNITSVKGILNGTTNYMLSKMATEGSTYEEALAEAQSLGFAESDPTNDVDGIDAAYKVAILSQFAFGMSLEVGDIEQQGIRGIAQADIQMAQQLGYEVKLIGSAEKNQGSVSANVGPVLVAKSHPLASVQNEMNGVYVKSSGVRESMYYGPGAGAKPTATSVVSDLITVAKNSRLGINGYLFNSYVSDTKLTSATEIKGKFYLSIQVVDKVGQFLKLTEIITGTGVSIDQLIQQKSANDSARIVAITHEMTKAQLMTVIDQINDVTEFKLIAAYEVLDK